MKRFLAGAVLALSIFSLQASVAEYTERYETLIEQVKPERQAKPRFTYPSFLGSLQEYYGEVSVDVNNLTFRDYSRIRGGYNGVFKLLLDVASDESLSKTQKFELLEKISEGVADSVEKLTKPYVDSDHIPQIEREAGENWFMYAGRWMWTHASFAFMGVVRDAGTLVNPMDSRSQFHLANIPRNAIESWGNIKRSYYLKRTAKDLKKTIKVESTKAKEDGAYNARVAALMNLVEEFYESDIESLRYARTHRWTGRFYLFMGWLYPMLPLPFHDIVADLPPFWGERTKYTGIMSAGLAGLFWTALYATRVGNSGLGFYKVLESIRKSDEKLRATYPASTEDSDLCQNLLTMQQTHSSGRANARKSRAR
jgi:hypothetical protein